MAHGSMPLVTYMAALTELDALLAIIEDDAASFEGELQLVFLGDYVDRGPASKGVLDRLLALPIGFKPFYILGNHDQTLLDFLENPSVFRDWRDFGGRETLMSYGVTPPRFDNEEAYSRARDMLRSVMPQTHLDFLRSLQYSVTIGSYYFVHAGSGRAWRSTGRRPRIYCGSEMSSCFPMPIWRGDRARPYADG